MAWRRCGLQRSFVGEYDGRMKSMFSRPGLSVGLLLLIVQSVALAQTGPVASPSNEAAVAVLQDGSRNGFMQMAFSPDGKWLATSTQGSDPVILWEAATGRKIRELTPGQALITEKLSTGGTLMGRVMVGAGSLSFSPDGKYLAAIPRLNQDITNASAWDQRCPPMIWEVATGKSLCEGTWTVEQNVARNPDCQWTPGEVMAWQFAKTYAFAEQFQHYQGPAQTISANGREGARIVDPGKNASIEILEVPSNRTVAVLPGPFLNPWGVALSPDAKYLALKSQGYGFEVWDLVAGKKLATLAPKEWAVNALAFSPDGKYLAAGAGESVRVYAVGTWEEIFTRDYQETANMHTITFSADSRLLAGIDEKLHVWDLQERRDLYEIGGSPLDAITAIAASADGASLAVAREGKYAGTYDIPPESEVELWRLTGTEPPTTFTNKVYPVQSLAFSHNSQWLGAATQQLSTTGRYTSILLGDVHLWRVSDRAETKLTIGKNQDDEYDFSATAVAFSPDDKQLVADVFTEGKLPPRDCDPDEQCGDPESLPYNVRTTFFDLASGRSVTSTPLGKSDSNMSPQERGFFSLGPDGRRAFTTRDGKLSYTDTLTGRPLRSFQQPVIAPAPSDIDQCGTTAGFVTFSPDVRRIAISDGRSLAIVDAHTGAGATKEPVLLGQTVESSDITANAGEFSPDGNLLVVSTCSLSNGAKLRIYAGSNLEMRHEVGIETTETALAFTPDGE